ncbi:MAG: hypothetical protein M0017_09770 [Desulfobacteraceae bacterium]|nr:hypothetical protein [Desulfobacteraceae bacterium]
MKCTTCGKKEGLTAEQRSLLAALAAAAVSVGAKEIAVLSGLDAKMVSCGLKSLKEKSLVESPARCRYAITAAGLDACES